MHTFDIADYGARKTAKLDIARQAIRQLPASAATRAVAASTANSIPALRAVVAQQATDLQVLYVTLDALLLAQGYDK